MRFYSYKGVAEWLEKFEYKTSYDSIGGKLYFCFNDTKGNVFTIMKYPDGMFTTHSKSENHCDEHEMLVSQDKLMRFVWRNRKAIHNAFKR